MENEKEITLDEVLAEFNSYHEPGKMNDISGALSVNECRRQAFNDLLVNLLAAPEYPQDIREWDTARWNEVVSFAYNFNAFLRRLDQYYRQQENKLKKAGHPLK